MIFLRGYFFIMSFITGLKFVDKVDDIDTRNQVEVSLDD